MKNTAKIKSLIVLPRKWSKFVLIWIFVLLLSACGPTEIEFAVKHLRDQTGEQLTEVVSYEDEARLDNSDGDADLQVQIQFERNYRHQIIERLTSNEISGQRVRDKIVELYKLPPNDLQTALCPIVVVIPAGAKANITVEWTERWAEGIINKGRDGTGELLGNFLVFLGYIEPCSLVGGSGIHAARPVLTTFTPKGRLEATFPFQMNIDEAAIVTVEIIVDSRFSEVGKHPEFVTGKISIQAESQSGDRSRLEEEIILYPVMSAELIASNFEVSNTSFSPRRRIGPATSAVWMWDITAKKAGKQAITIDLYGSDIVEDETDDELIKVISRNIDVYDVSVYRKLFSYLSKNWIAIVGTNGPLALIIAYLTFRFNQKSKQEKGAVSSKNEVVDVPNDIGDE